MIFSSHTNEKFCHAVCHTPIISNDIYQNDLMKNKNKSRSLIVGKIHDLKRSSVQPTDID
jgi:hypothetical protein